MYIYIYVYHTICTYVCPGPPRIHGVAGVLVARPLVRSVAAHLIGRMHHNSNATFMFLMPEWYIINIKFK